MRRGVFVVGMHRSGTSPATRLVNLLGVPGCVEDDLLPGTADNPRGYWESRSLAALNDRIFAAFESDWSCPPVLAPGWERAPQLDELRSEAIDVFSRVFPTEQWVWKDPRNCITLPFWLGWLEVEPVIVLVRRNPLQIAASLGARDDLGRVYCLALWERYLRACLASVSGLPTLVTTYDDLLDDPRRWSDAARAFLGNAGVATREVESSALDYVDTTLRHTRFTHEDAVGDPAMSNAQRELLGIVEGLHGTHEALSTTAFSPETPTTEALLRATAAVPARSRASRARRVLALARRAVRRAAALLREPREPVRRAATELRGPLEPVPGASAVLRRSRSALSGARGICA